ncbi:MAG: hypothetical protein NVSMB9_28200 [Isosphaeraceae bacterium]
MGAIWLRQLGPALALLAPPLDPHESQATGHATTVETRSSGGSEAGKGHSLPAAEPEPGNPETASGPKSDEGRALRAEAEERLKQIPGLHEKSATAADRAWREVFETRLAWIHAWEKAHKERVAAENPNPSPETLARESHADLERTRGALEQLAKDPEALLPAVFRNATARSSDSVRSEMKEAIDAATVDLKEWSTKLESFLADSSQKPAGTLTTLRASRDRTFQRLAAVRARKPERTAEAGDLKSPEALKLARERRVNTRWEIWVESERLRGEEALLALEGRRTELSALNRQVLEAHVQLAQRVLARMTGRYRALTTRQEHDLHQAAVKEQTRSEHVNDPVERYHAKQASEILELEARVLMAENALTTNPSPTLEEQRAAADRAETDFTNIKHLLDDGRISHLDALRLSNDFRRIEAERTRIIRRELAVTSDRLATAENALSGVELELIYDTRDDRYELDNLLERIPRSEHAKAIAVFDEFERKHLALLNRRQGALEKLAARAEQTHEQVVRRLRILEDHFGFIRTNLFWVRDEDPVSLATAAQAQRELRHLARAAFRITTEVSDRGGWGRISPEFMLATFGMFVLPWPLRKLSRSLRGGPLIHPLVTDDTTRDSPDP